MRGTSVSILDGEGNGGEPGGESTEENAPGGRASGRTAWRTNKKLNMVYLGENRENAEKKIGCGQVRIGNGVSSKAKKRGDGEKGKVVWERSKGRYGDNL